MKTPELSTSDLLEIPVDQAIKWSQSVINLHSIPEGVAEQVIELFEDISPTPVVLAVLEAKYKEEMNTVALDSHLFLAHTVLQARLDRGIHPDDLMAYWTAYRIIRKLAHAHQFHADIDARLSMIEKSIERSEYGNHFAAYAKQVNKILEHLTYKDLIVQVRENLKQNYMQLGLGDETGPSH